MPGESAREARQRAKNYKQALKYLDECGAFTIEEFREVHRIGGIDIPESKLRSIWKEADYMLPIGGQPGGTETLRRIMRDELIRSIAIFEELAEELAEELDATA